MTLATLSEILAPATTAFTSPSSKFLGFGSPNASEIAEATFGISLVILSILEAVYFTFSVASWTFSAISVTFLIITSGSGASFVFAATSGFDFLSVIIGFLEFSFN